MEVLCVYIIINGLCNLELYLVYWEFVHSAQIDQNVIWWMVVVWYKCRIRFGKWSYSKLNVWLVGVSEICLRVVYNWAYNLICVAAIGMRPIRGKTRLNRDQLSCRKLVQILPRSDLKEWPNPELKLWEPKNWPFE